MLDKVKSLWSKEEKVKEMIKEEKNNKFGVLKYSSQNIGDEIQSVAAMRFLPQIDYYMHRERLDKFVSDEGEKVKLIMNAWWMWNPKHFPPSKDVDPLLVSMYIRDSIREKFLRPEVKEYLMAHGPVGCRDLSTMEYLKENGVEAYFSGCLTLTLQANKYIKETRGGDYILCVDTPKEIVAEVKKRTNKPVYDITRMLTVSVNSIQRLELAKIMLYLYHNAHCIVTPRLHVALPSTAFETPVLLLKLKDFDRRGRFEGLSQVCNEYTDKEFMENKDIYDFEHPKANPGKHLEIRNNLIRICSEFTGYDSGKPLFDDHYEPLISLIDMLKYDYENVKRTLWFADENDLLDVLFRKQKQKKTKHDLTY